MGIFSINIRILPPAKVISPSLTLGGLPAEYMPGSNLTIYPGFENTYFIQLISYTLSIISVDITYSYRKNNGKIKTVTVPVQGQTEDGVSIATSGITFPHAKVNSVANISFNVTTTPVC